MSCPAAAGSSNQAGQGENLDATQLSHLSSVATTSVQDLREATASTQSPRGKPGARADAAKGNSRRSATHPGQTSRHAHFERQQEHAQTSEDHRRHLAGLIESGVLSRSSALRLSVKVRASSPKTTSVLIAIKLHETTVRSKAHCFQKKTKTNLCVTPAGPGARGSCHGQGDLEGQSRQAVLHSDRLGAVYRGRRRPCQLSRCLGQGKN